MTESSEGANLANTIRGLKKFDGRNPAEFKTWMKSRSTIGGVGDTTIPSPGWSTKQPLPGVGLHDPLHGRQA